jgi:hypothetical protein
MLGDHPPLEVAVLLQAPLHEIERFVATVHGGEPDVRCELPGAFAGSKLPALGPYVPGATWAEATAGSAMAATSTVARVRLTWTTTGASARDCCSSTKPALP